MSDQPMTRRARREAERAAERAAEQPGGRAAEGSARAAADQDSQVPPEAQTSSDGQAAPGALAGQDSQDRHAVQDGEHRLSRAGRLPRTSGQRGSARQRQVRVAQVMVLALLATATLAVPLQATARTGADTQVAASARGLAAAGAGQSGSGSVADAVLGTDADLDDGSDVELTTVPDAATLARIREAYTNATTTCAPRTGASGDAGAFDTAPTVFNPMLPGTYVVSSPYGYRIHPTLGYLKLHAGQDYAASTGTPIYAVAAGTVITAGMVGDTGTVTIEHELDGRTWYTTYMHMYADGIYVHVGDKVSAGQLIAGVGSTGRSTGPHLHLEVWTAREGGEGSTTDPAAWLRDHKAVDLTTDCG